MDAKYRTNFPILEQNIYKKPLVYLDNAATTQKPKEVIEALSGYYETLNSNIHRGVHYLSQKATEEFELARKCVQQFIHAAHHYEVIFTRGATESINLIANSFGRTFISEGDEIIISEMEHHSNIVPWQLVCEERGAKLQIIPFDDKGVLQIDKVERMITPRTKMVAITHVSNTLGTINPVKEVVRIAHAHKVPVMIDGAQAVAHCCVDVQDLDCDFYCFSGHKMYAPMGVGIMYGKEQWLNQMKPYQGGGDMISHVSFEKTTYNELPFKFEAGTPAVGDVIGLRKAIEYMQRIGVEKIANHENELLHYATEQLLTVDGLKIYGEAPLKAGVISFLVKKIHPYDMGVLLDHQGIAVRTGHHCTQPIMTHFDIPGTVRASFALYTTKEDIDILIHGVRKAAEMLQ